VLPCQSLSELQSLQVAPPKVPLDPIEQSKKLAAYTAVDNHVKPEHRVSVQYFDVEGAFY